MDERPAHERAPHSNAAHHAGNARCHAGLLQELTLCGTITPYLRGVQNGADAPKLFEAEKVETVLVSMVVPVPESPFLDH
jgi:hypothetical protein